MINYIDQKTVFGLFRITQAAYEKFKNSCHHIIDEMEKLKISRQALYGMNKLHTQPVESGGVLLGPIGKNIISHFYLDRNGRRTGITYSPDCATINRKLREQWLPVGLEIKGLAHSHKANLDGLTAGDMSYIKRLIQRNPYMSSFIAPVVLPDKYSIKPYVISRSRNRCVKRAYFELI